MRTTTVYTIGHSNHTIDYFAELLDSFSINCVIDVRSTPASSYSPQFNREPLSNYLKRKNILYMHFGKEFGARFDAPELLDESGKVDFEKVRLTETFLEGVKRLQAGIDKGYTVSLMCSEGEPFDCHRFSMIAVYLEAQGWDVRHILKDKTVIPNAKLEIQLLKKYHKKIPHPNLLEPDITPEMQLQAAYRLRNKDVAYSPYEDKKEESI